MSAHSKKLRADNASDWEKAKAILDTAESEDRALTAEETASFDAIHVAMEGRKATFERIETNERAQPAPDITPAATPNAAEGRSNAAAAAPNTPEISVGQATAAFLRYGPGDMTDDEKAVLGMTRASREDAARLVGADSALARQVIGAPMIRLSLSGDPLDRVQFEDRVAGQNFRERRNVIRAMENRQRARETRAQAAETANVGGNVVADEPMQPLEDALLAFNGLRRSRATVLSTATGADLPIPTSDDTSNEGVLLGENTEETTVTDIAFGQVVLQAFKFSSDIVKASLEYLQDVSIDPNAHIFRKLGERIGRAQATYGTTGTGSSQPEGITVGASAGLNLAAVSAVTYNEMLTLKHAVDPDYRESAEWMFGDPALLAIKKIAVGSSDANPLWKPGIAVGDPDTIDGDPYVINPKMPAITTGNVKPIIYGDLSKFMIRDVMDILILRLVERYAEFGQVGFIGFARMDSAMVDAGTAPVKYARTPAS